MKVLILILTAVGLLVTMLVSASTIQAAGCNMEPINACSGQAETDELLVDAVAETRFITPGQP